MEVITSDAGRTWASFKAFRAEDICVECLLDGGILTIADAHWCFANAFVSVRALSWSEKTLEVGLEVTAAMLGRFFWGGRMQDELRVGGRGSGEADGRGDRFVIRAFDGMQDLPFQEVRVPAAGSIRRGYENLINTATIDKSSGDPGVPVQVGKTVALEAVNQGVFVQERLQPLHLKGVTSREGSAGVEDRVPYVGRGRDDVGVSHKNQGSVPTLDCDAGMCGKVGKKGAFTGFLASLRAVS